MFILKLIWYKTGDLLLVSIEIFDFYKDCYFTFTFPHTEEMYFFLYFSITVPYLAASFFNGGFLDGAKTFFSFGFLLKDEDYYSKRLNAMFFVALF